MLSSAAVQVAQTLLQYWLLYGFNSMASDYASQWQLNNKYSINDGLEGSSNSFSALHTCPDYKFLNSLGNRTSQY